MDLRNEVGHNNMSFQMESEVEHDAQTCDDKAIRNDTPQAKPKVKAQPYKDSDTEKIQRVLFIASAIAVASLLTALATLVLGVAIMIARSEVPVLLPQLFPVVSKRLKLLISSNFKTGTN